MKKRIRNLITILGICLMAGFLTSCKEKPVTNNEEKMKSEIVLADNSITIELGKQSNLNDLVSITGDQELKNTLTYSKYDEEIIKITDGIISAEKIGSTTIYVAVSDPEVREKKINVLVTDLADFDIEGTNALVVGERAEYIVYPTDLNIPLKSSDENILMFVDGQAVALAEGKVTLTAEYMGSIREHTVRIKKDTIKPTISSTGEDNIIVSYNEDVDLLEGLKATDNIDGEIEVSIMEGYNKEKMGKQVVTYMAVDSSGNEATFKRNVEVIWDYSVKFIGHAGSYYGLMNSEEAILYAIQVLQYQCVEIDLKQTADGQFVLCHDDTFAGYPLATTMWSVLKELTRTAERCSGLPAQNGSVKKKSYTAGLCTLERYLEICKEYDVKAVIELKSSKGISNADTSRMQDLMNIIEKYKMRKNVIFLTSSYNCLIWTRENGYSDIPCQYLVNSCESDEVLNRCIQYDLDISFNATGDNIKNSQEWINKYKAAGLEVSCYTFTQYSDYNTLQKWIDKGVDYVTCDWHLMSKVKLPKEEK